MSAPLSLADLAPGRRARVCAIEPLPDRLETRLVDLGIDTGSLVEVVHRGPFGDPLAVRVDGTTVALRRSIARAIRLDPA